MPGYGVRPASEGTGLLAWDEVSKRFAASHDYWLATTRPDGRPHAMPVWGVWDGVDFWFSSSLRSRKVCNLSAQPQCVVSTADALDPVVLEGTAVRVDEPEWIARFLGLLNAKYETEYGLDLVDPSANATVRVHPATAFALLAADFSGSPTRFTFGGDDDDDDE